MRFGDASSHKALAYVSRHWRPSRAGLNLWLKSHEGNNNRNGITPSFEKDPRKGYAMVT